MEITFNVIKDKEIINVYDGKKLGHAVDVCFDKNVACVLGIIVPGEKRLFKKADEIFIPISKIKRIGEDVVLVKLSPEETPENFREKQKNINFRDVEIKNTNRVYTKYKRPIEKEK